MTPSPFQEITDPLDYPATTALASNPDYNSFAYRMGNKAKSITNGISNAWNSKDFAKQVNNIIGGNKYIAPLVLASILAPMGYVGGRMLGQRPAYLGTAAGLLAGLLGGNVLNQQVRKNVPVVTPFSKTSSIKSANDDLTIILNKLKQDFTMSDSDKVALLNMLQTLPPDKIRMISLLLRTVVGAGAGAIIFKFLNQSGILGGVLGGITSYFLS